jgi:thiamine biosynthesis lipoprotein
MIFTVIIMMNIVSCSLFQPKKHQASFLILFNTITEIVGYAHSEKEFKEFAQFLYDNLEEYHQLYDKYNSYPGINNIKTINDRAGKEPVKVDSRIIDLLLYSKEMYAKTNGKVNIAMGAVLEIWHDYRSDGVENPEDSQLPPMAELEAANQHTNIEDVIIDEEESTVYLADPLLRLDVGAIAKGYATEQVVEIALQEGYENFLLSVGGNVRSVGIKPDVKEPWSVGIQNPDKSSEQKNIFILSLSDLSLVASGDYERYYTVNGKRYHHIIDPSTLMPAEYFAAVSIVCEDSGLADALSTAVFNLPYEEGKALIETFEGVEALWIYSNGDMKFSDNFKGLIKD